MWPLYSRIGFDRKTGMTDVGGIMTCSELDLAVAGVIALPHGLLIVGLGSLDRSISTSSGDSAACRSLPLPITCQTGTKTGRQSCWSRSRD